MKKILLSIVTLSAILGADVYVKMTEKEYYTYMQKIVKEKGYITSVKSTVVPKESAIIVMSVGNEIVAEIVETLEAKNDGLRQLQFFTKGIPVPNYKYRSKNTSPEDFEFPTMDKKAQSSLKNTIKYLEDK